MVLGSTGIPSKVDNETAGSIIFDFVEGATVFFFKSSYLVVFMKNETVDYLRE